MISRPGEKSYSTTMAQACNRMASCTFGSRTVVDDLVLNTTSVFEVIREKSNRPEHFGGFSYFWH